MSLIIKKDVLSEETIFALKGILDISTSHIMDSYLENIGDNKILVFDFSDLEFIDSTGIGSIINAIYTSAKNKTVLKLRGIDELTHQVFETVGLYQILDAIQEEVV
jgi:anti-anti-sigma factor